MISSSASCSLFGRITCGFAVVDVRSLGAVALSARRTFAAADVLPRFLTMRGADRSLVRRLRVAVQVASCCWLAYTCLGAGLTAAQAGAGLTATA